MGSSALRCVGATLLLAGAVALPACGAGGDDAAVRTSTAALRAPPVGAAPPPSSGGGAGFLEPDGASSHTLSRRARRIALRQERYASALRRAQYASALDAACRRVTVPSVTGRGDAVDLPRKQQWLRGVERELALVRARPAGEPQRRLTRAYRAAVRNEILLAGIVVRAREGADDPFGVEAGERQIEANRSTRRTVGERFDSRCLRRFAAAG